MKKQVGKGIVKKAVWISYDLGVKGDYEGLYTWLDSHKAIECGDSLAYIKWETNKEGDLHAEVKAELKKAVELTRHDRIYVIWRDPSGLVRGRFIFGTRKAAPWTGYHGEEVAAEEEA